MLLSIFQSYVAYLVTIVLLMVILTCQSKDDTSVVFKKRSEWTKKEKAEYQKCRRERRKEGKKLTHLYLLPKHSGALSGAPTDHMEVTKLDLFAAGSKVKVLKFPGCFDLEAEIFIDPKSTLLKGWKKRRLPNWVTQLTWELQTGTDGSDSGLFKDMKCENRDRNGCNGLGNGCFYCNFCKEHIEKQQKEDGVKKSERTSCPRQTGYSHLKKKDVCFDDWGSMDHEKDGEPDFLCYPNMGRYSELIESVSGSGYGHIKVVMCVARNDTKQFRKAKLALNAGSFGKWHKLFHLPQVMKKGLLACGVAVFDVCTQPPILTPDGEPICGPSQNDPFGFEKR